MLEITILFVAKVVFPKKLLLEMPYFSIDNLIKEVLG